MNVQNEILLLVEKSMSSKEGNKLYLDFAEVEISEANNLKKLTGLNFSGYKHSLDRSGIIHALKHQNIEVSDILLIPCIIQSPDNLKVGNKPNIIIYEKLIGDKYFYVEEIRKGRKKLSIKTLYKVSRQKKHQVKPSAS